jgi:RNA polymerase sigma-70 factor (ECF subfamily)
MFQQSSTRANNQDSRTLELQGFSDEKIMLEVRHGSGDAFTVLFDRYHRLVLVTALKIVRDVGEAEEVTQNVFFEIYRSARQFDPARGNLKVWLLQYAYHRSINRRNYLLLRQFYNQPDLQEALNWESGTKVTSQLPTQEVEWLVKEAMRVLDEPQRRTIRMVFFDGMSLREVADQTQQSFSKIRNQYYRGLDRLRSSLTPESVALRKERVTPVGEVSRAKA